MRNKTTLRKDVRRNSIISWAGKHEPTFQFLVKTSLKAFLLSIYPGYADSGATSLMNSQRWVFRDFASVKPRTWQFKDIGLWSLSLHANGVRDFPIRSRMNGIWIETVLKEALLFPEPGVNIFSIRCVTKSGATCIFSCNRLRITGDGKVIAGGGRRAKRWTFLF